MERRSRRRRVVRLIAPILAVVLAVLAVVPARADDIQDKKNQKQQENSLIGSLQSQIAATQNQEVQVQALIAVLANQISISQTNVDAAQVKFEKINADLVVMQSQLAATITKFNSDRVTLASETKLMYVASNDSTPVNNVVGAHSFNEFFVKLLDTQRVATQEQKLVDTVSSERARAEQEVVTITAKQADQQKVLKQLAGQRNQLAVQQGAQVQLQRKLQVFVAQDQQRMAQAEAAAKALDTEIAGLVAAQEEAARLVAAQEAAARQRAADNARNAGNGGNGGNPGGGGGSGQFSWPMSGGISQGFGCTPFFFEPYDPNCPSRHFHTGIDIANGCGTPVHAAQGGLAFAYYDSYGFGRHVIIVHGNGLSSVYGHLGSIAISNGQAVTRSQYIGDEGSTGNSTGCHLHFEVRLNGQPRTPYDYLP